MMTPEQLKNSILQRAIEGKLVPCDLSKWKQVKLGDIVTKKIKRGKSPKYVPKSNTMVFAQKCNTKNGRIDMSLAYFLDESKLQNYDEQEFMCNDDIVVNSTGTGTMGRVGIFNDEDRIDNMQVVPDSHVTVIRVNGDCSAKFIFYVLKSSQKLFEKNGDGSTNQKELKAAFLNSYLFNLPPLAEQKRIVAKLEELLPLVDEYAKAYEQLQSLNAKFPGDLKKSLLQYAMEGKLVPQIASEGTGADLLAEIKKARLAVTVGEGGPLAVEGVKSRKNKKQKDLAPISDEEKPFEIPDTWTWCRLGDVCDKIVDGDHNPPPGISEKSEFFMISAVNVNNDRLVNLDTVRYLDENTFKSENQRTNIVKGNILFTIVGTMGRSCVYSDNYNISCQRSVCVIETNIFNFFLKHILDSPYIQNYVIRNSSGTAQKGFYLKQVSNLVVPLSPLAEQKRIVAKLEELLPLCDELK